jgi:acetyl esterase
MRCRSIFLLFTTFTVSAFAVDAEPAEGKRYVYKQVDGDPREMEIYFPVGWDPSKRTYPGIILFHGGGWGNGSLAAFRYQCEYFASRGLVAATANYTLVKSQGYTGEGSRKRVCIVDAKSAIRWLKTHADELGLDPSRLIAGGGSAGGHVSMLATHNPGLNDPHDPEHIDTSVAAYVLFNPAFTSADAEDSEVDMLQHLNPDMPPAIVFFGTEDKWKSGWETVQQKLESLGATNIDLRLAPGAEHAFFNRQPWTDLTLIAADQFLTELGFLEGSPTLQAPSETMRLMQTD